jgi:hypothetical protein
MDFGSVFFIFMSLLRPNPKMAVPQKAPPMAPAMPALAGVK